MRRLLQQLAAVRGVDLRDQPLDRGVLSLVFTSWQDSLSPAEHARRAAAACSCPAALTYPSLKPDLLLHAIVEAALTLVGEMEMVIAVPRLQATDAETGWALHALMRRAPGTLRFVIGDDPAFVAGDPVAQFAMDGHDQLLRRWGALDGVAIERIDVPLDEPIPGERPAEADIISVGSTGDRIARVRDSFDAYGTGYAHALALLTLAREPGSADAAELQAIAGLCASQLVRLPSGATLDATVAPHFEAALASAGGPKRFPYLLCRLAVIETNRRHFDRAEFLVEQALALAAAEELSPAYSPFLAAWALNARALQCYRTDQADEAGRMVREAIALVDGCPDTPETPAFHRQYTHLTLCRNMVAVNLQRGDRKQARAWHAELDRYADRMPAWYVAPPSEFIVLLSEGDFEAAVPSLDTAIARARASLNPSAEAFANHLLGQALFRSGNPSAAYQYFARALTLWEALEADTDQLTQAVMNAAFAALYGDQPVAAAALLTRLDGALDAGQRGECQAALALAHARSGGDPAPFAATARHLLAAAPADARLRGVALLAQSLPRAAGLALIEEALETDGVNDLAPGDRLTALATAVELGSTNGPWLQQAAALAPAALKDDDAAVWWACRRLQRATQEFIMPRV